MVHAVIDGKSGVALLLDTIHGLQEEVLELELFELLGHGLRLREDQFKFRPVSQHEFGASLGAHADPVEASRSGLGSIGLDCNLKALGVQSVDRVLVQLKKGFAARAHDQRFPAAVNRPVRSHSCR